MRPAGDPVCAVVGLGFVGTSTLRLVAKAGLVVRGYDVSPAAVARARESFARDLPSDSRWSVGEDPAVLGEAEVVLVAVRLGRDEAGHFRDDVLRKVASTLRAHGRDGQLVLLESTMLPGTTRRFAEAWLQRPGIEVAHAPERLRIGEDDAATLATPRLIGGLTPAITERGRGFLARIGLQAVPVPAPEVSELSKLLENAFLTVNIALVGEITRLAHAHGVAAGDVTAAAATKPHGFMPFHPGPGIGGHCLRNDLDILRQHAGALGLSTPMLDGVAMVAEELPALTVARLAALLAETGGLAGARILLVGVGFKIGSPDATETPAEPIARLLRAAGAAPVYCDSQVPALSVDGVPLTRLQPGELRGADLKAAIILGGDRELAFQILRDACAHVLDTGGGRIMGEGLAGVSRL